MKKIDKELWNAADASGFAMNAAMASLFPPGMVFLDKAGCMDAARLAIASGANPNAMDRNGTTALMMAAFRGSDEMVKLLLPVSDAKLKTNAGMSALMIAAFWGQPSTFKLLLPHSDTDEATKKGETLLELATRGKNPAMTSEIVALLEAHGWAPPLAEIARQTTPKIKPKRYVQNIWQAVDKGDMDEFMRHLKKVCAAGTLSTPTIGGNRGTILHMTVAFTENFGMFKALIDAGADPYVKNSDGDDVLAHARRIGRFGETAQEHASRVEKLAAYIAQHEAKILAADLSTASAQARSATRL